MDRRQEVAIKLARVRDWLAHGEKDGVLFTSHGNFAWITGGGRNHCGIAADHGVAGVLITLDGAYLLADNIEARRVMEEELGEVADAFELVEGPWWSSGIGDLALSRMASGELITDGLPISLHRLSTADGIALRNPLLPTEVERYRQLGQRVGIALTHTAFHCRPGLSEHQLAGMLAGTLTDLGIVPAVVLVAVDARVWSRRHPIPTDLKLEHYAMLVVGARQAGLNASATRLIHFGEPPAELLRRHRACAGLDAAMIAATRPGRLLGELFNSLVENYRAAGFPDEWQLHHQGGPTGYFGRDQKATPDSRQGVLAGQAFAWNPSITGAKSEDTILVGEDMNEVLTPTPDLPSIPATGRADILLR